MGDSKVIRCASCDAPLEVELNRSFIYCMFCGCKNIISSEQMTTNIQFGGVTTQAHTDVDSILAAAEYAIEIKQFDKADELLMTAIISGTNDYRIYILKAKSDLQTDNNQSLFRSLDKLRRLEAAQGPNKEVTMAVRALMHVRGMNGVTVLHNAAFHELFDWVVYCVYHGADVNCVAGMNRVTPISIMFVPVSSSLSGLDGTPFIRHKDAVKRIRDFLLSRGATDVKRRGY